MFTKNDIFVCVSMCTLGANYVWYVGILFCRANWTDDVPVGDG
jgi:hypothetical protein